MTRYTDRKSGLTIGSDNWFFLRNEADEHKEYRAMVWAKSYNQPLYHANVRTPAQQLIWWDASGFDEIVLHYTLAAWLDKELGPRGLQWDVRPNGEHRTSEEPLFFRTRAHAVHFANHIDGMVKELAKCEYI